MIRLLSEMHSAPVVDKLKMIHLPPLPLTSSTTTQWMAMTVEYRRLTSGYRRNRNDLTAITSKVWPIFGSQCRSLNVCRILKKHGE